MKKKLLAAVSAVAIALGLVAVTSAPASAHHNTVQVSVSCTNELKYEVVWSITNSEAKKTETITASSLPDVVPVGTTLKGGETLTFKQSVDSKQPLTLTISAKWSTGETKVGDFATLTEKKFPNCSPQHTDVTLCHANNGVKGFTVITVDDDAVVKKGGHGSHDDDIIPSFQYWAEVDGKWTKVTYPGKNLGTLYDGATGAQVLANDCVVPPPAPECIPSSAVTYTYDKTTNSGSITVPQLPNSTGLLCDSFFVTATSWKFTTDKAWPQKLDVVNKLPEITGAGVYPYAAAVSCGQGDIYASFTESPTPTAYLDGPGDPYNEHFLHQMGFTGPTPTWTQNEPGCNKVPVTVPVPNAIDQCGEYGSIVVPADTEAIDYTLTGNGQTGINTVTAVAKGSYVLVGYPEGGWSFDLKQYYECVTAPEVDYDLGACYPNGDFSSKNLFFVFDNTKSNVPVTFAVQGTDISVEVPGGQSTTIEGTPAWQYGVSYTVTATGVDEPFVITVPAFEGCQIAEIPAQPQAYPEVCVDGETSDGSIWVDYNPSVVYSIRDTATDEVIPVTQATTSVPAGTYEVTVKAAPGFVLEDDGDWPYTVTVAEDDSCEATPVAPGTTGQTCSVENEVESGTITVTAVEGIVYTVNGVELTEESTEFPIGSYEVIATAEEGYSLPGGVEQISYPVTIVLEEECELPTFAEVEASASATDEVCLPDGSVKSGAITVDETEHVLYFLDGKAVTAAVTEVEPGKHTVTAVTDSEDYVIIGDDEWTFTVDDAADCAGAGGGGSLASTGPENVLPFAALSALLLLLGSAAVFGRRRSAQPSTTEH